MAGKVEAGGIMRASAAKRVQAGTMTAAGPGLAEHAVSPLTAPAAGHDLATNLAGLHAALEGVRGRLDDDPFSNPIALLSHDICRLMCREELDEKAAHALIQRLTREAFDARAKTARKYLGELDPATNEASITRLLTGLAHDADGALVPFETFAGRVQRVYYGFVFTSHPTFGRTMELQVMLAAAAFGPEAGDAAAPRRRELLDRAEKIAHRPPLKLDLAEEHAQSLLVISEARAVIRRVYEVAFGIAQELYPADWRRLRPGLLTLATWVGYDTDGRADISWTMTFAKRLLIQLDQLRHYRTRVLACLDRARGETALAPLLELLEARLALAIKSAEDDIGVLEAPGHQDADWRKRLARVAKDMVSGRGTRLADAAQA
jgi:phosphoenolpyruvate carboxylase